MDEPAVGQGFEIAMPCVWQNPDSAETILWIERRLVVQSEAHAHRQRAALQERLAKAEAALANLNLRPAADRTDRESRAQTILKRYDLAEYLSLNFNEQGTSQTRYVGRGRPGPDRPTQTIQTHSWTVETLRQTAAIDLFNRLAGWRFYLTNAPASRLTLAGAVNCYRQQWQPEHGFHRLKGGLLGIMPLYLRDDERLLKAFDNITLYRHTTKTEVRYEVTPLSPLQCRILKALGIPESVYAHPPL